MNRLQAEQDRLMAGQQERPKVSVIIPCYNQGIYLDEAVRSVLDQTFQDLEIIVVNDGSTDAATNDLLSSYRRPKTAVFHVENGGLAGARNFGIRHSNGEYVLPLDSDDKLRPTYLEKAIAVLDANPKVGFVACWAEFFGEEKYIWKTRSFDLKDALVRNYICSCTLFRKRCWEEVNGYDEQMRAYEDWNFWISVIKKGWTGEVICEPLFLYRRKANSMIRESNRVENRLKLFERVIDNNFDLYKDHLKYVLLEKERRVAEVEEKIRMLKSSVLFRAMERSGFFWLLKRLRVVDVDLLES